MPKLFLEIDLNDPNEMAFLQSSNGFRAFKAKADPEQPEI
jgi:hypothetical protein